MFKLGNKKPEFMVFIKFETRQKEQVWTGAGKSAFATKSNG